MRSTAPTRPRRTWELRPQHSAIAARLSREAGLGPVAARVMAARGWKDPKSLSEFLTCGLSMLHDPWQLPDVAAAVERLAQAIRDGEKMCVFGDYDVDGTTGTAVLVKTLRWLGAEHVAHATPHRLNEGYGIRPEAVERLSADGISLIVTVDNGTTAFEALSLARERGIEVIVADHHRIQGEIPRVRALINPWRQDNEYPFRELCGCALAFKLSQALAKAMGRSAEEAKPFLTGLLDLVAVATVADVMPLCGENRALVRSGLRRLGDSAHLGLRSLIEVAGVGGRLTADSIAWVLGPRLNAAGRTSHASLAIELLTTEDPHRAQHLARHLEHLNAERRRIEDRILAEALEELESHGEDPVVVLARPGWHLGVLGIVAARVLERVERPTILLTVEDDVARGSGRSVPGFDLHAALCACDEHLVSFGGHPMAAGVHCAAERVDALRAALIDHALALGPDALRPRPHVVDTELQPEELIPETVEDIERLEPFGEGHPRPLFALRGWTLAGPPKVLKRRHLKFRLVSTDGRPLTALGWGMAERLGELLPAPQRLDLLGRLKIDEWNGRRSLDFVLTDWQIAEP